MTLEVNLPEPERTNETADQLLERLGLVEASMSFNHPDPDSLWGAPGVSIMAQYNRKVGLWRRFKNRLAGKIVYQKYDVEEFFKLIKDGKSELTTEAAKQYGLEVIQQVRKANTLGQTHLITKLTAQAEGLQKEIQIINELGLSQYVFERDISELERIGIEGRMVRRKSLEKYESVIPDECMDSIVTAVNAKLFDEIIIIYTRKNDKPVELDKKRKSRGSSEHVDPICFGKIKATGRLFFICDWIDDECDLDMKKMQTLVDVNKLVEIKE